MRRSVDDLRFDETDTTPRRYGLSAPEFLAGPVVPLVMLIPELLPAGAMMLVHGEPRSGKSLFALELAVAAATGTPLLGLARFQPPGPMAVFYVQEEDMAALTRIRLDGLVRGRRVEPPKLLTVAARTGLDLDDPTSSADLLAQMQELDTRLLILDPIRRLSGRADEGPQKVRELIAILRRVVDRTGASIVIVHHDTKPPPQAFDLRRRSQRASGGDWFAACECPVHVEKVGPNESLVFPQDYKHGEAPAPFTVQYRLTVAVITTLWGVDTTAEHAERAGVRGKIFEWLRINGPATRTDMKKAGVAQWPAIEAALDLLVKEGRVDAAPGRTRQSLRYFVPSLDDASNFAHADPPF